MRSALWVVLLLGCTGGELEAFRSTPAGGAPGGGAPGSGGAAGQAGPSEVLVDDFEDQNTRALDPFGWWYNQNDTTGSQTFNVSAVVDRPGSNFAAYTSGVGFVEWGAIVGLDFTPGDGPYDLGAFNQIRFWAKAGSGNRVTLSVQILEGTDAHFGQELSLTTTWTEYRFDFAALAHTGGDASRRLDATQASALQLFILSPEAFEFWVDDVVVAR